LADGRAGDAEFGGQPREMDGVPDGAVVLTAIVVADRVNTDLGLAGNISFAAEQENERAGGVAFLGDEDRQPPLACQGRDGKALIERASRGLEVEANNPSFIVEMRSKLHIIAGLDIAAQLQDVAARAACDARNLHAEAWFRDPRSEENGQYGFGHPHHEPVIARQAAATDRRPKARSDQYRYWY